MAESQHLLFLGHTGLGKRIAVQNLAREYLNTAHGLATGLDHVNHPKYLRVECLEDHLPDIHAVLDLTNESDARRRWLDALKASISKLNVGPGSAHLILSLHGSYYRKARAFSLADLEAIRDLFTPTAVVVLIDDIYDVAATIKERDSQDALRLREIATWRSIEGMIGDFIATPMGIPNYTLAVKHPVSTGTRLLFTDVTRVYSAFPISRHRKNPSGREEIQEFKSRLRQEGYAVFDPSTIDELFLRAELEEADIGADQIDLGRVVRWELAQEPRLCDGRPDPWANVEKRFSRSEIAEATQDITKQVESRDFRLIHDSDCVVAYRPNWGGRPSRGVTAELHLARGIGRRAFIYSPKEDEPDEQSPFGDLGNLYRDLDDMLSGVKQFRPDRNKA